MNKKKILFSALSILVLIVIAIIIILILNNTNNELSVIEGVWVADKTQYIYLLGYENGEPIYSNASTPYYLTLDKKGNFKLELSDAVFTGTYIYGKEDGSLVLLDDENLIMENCELKNDIELHCDRYAYIYVKQ